MVLNSPATDSDSNVEEVSNPTANANPNALNPTNRPGIAVVSLGKFASHSAAAAFSCSVFGFGSALLKGKGFKRSFTEAAGLAKTSAAVSVVPCLVVCLLKRLRGKDDVITSGVAGCCTGLALSFPGAPQALLQSCLAFGAFSVIIEGLYRRQQPARALTSSTSAKDHRHMSVLPPLAFPLPHEFKDSFSSFFQSLRNHTKSNSRF